MAHNTRVPVARLAVDAVRHVLPLLPLYIHNGELPSYAVLTAFDLALGLMLIVGTTRDRGDVTRDGGSALATVRARLLAVIAVAIFRAIFSAVVALVLTVATAMLAGSSSDVDGVDWRALAADRGSPTPIAVMALVAGARASARVRGATTPGERGTTTDGLPASANLEGDRRRSLVAYAAQVTLIGTYVALSYALTVFGGSGYAALPVVFAGAPHVLRRAPGRRAADLSEAVAGAIRADPLTRYSALRRPISFRR